MDFVALNALEVLSLRAIAWEYYVESYTKNSYCPVIGFPFTYPLNPLHLVWASHSLLFQLGKVRRLVGSSVHRVVNLPRHWIVASRERAWPVGDHSLNLQCITTCLTRTYLNKTGSRKRQTLVVESCCSHKIEAAKRFDKKSLNHPTLSLNN
jgi:hypothetical protein